MNSVQVLLVGTQKEELLKGVDQLLYEEGIPLRFERAPGPTKALAMLSDRSFDAVVCVVENPDELAVVVRLRKAVPETPILLMADSPGSETARLGRSLGASGVLERNPSQESFVKALKQILQTQRLTREQRSLTARTLDLSRDISALAHQAMKQARGARERSGGAAGAGGSFTKFAPLLVEDDPNWVLLMGRAFAQAQLPGPVEVLRDGEEAITYLSGKGAYADRTRHPVPSLVILDLRLPRKSGFEVLEWIRGNPQLAALPVVVLSATLEPADLERARALGTNLYLVKPAGLAALLETVRAIAGYWAICSNPPAPPTDPS